MTNKELLRALIAEIDLIMHDKDYRFPESENTWYSRESCKVLNSEEVFEELRAELIQLNNETNSKIAELQKQLEASETQKRRLFEKVKILDKENKELKELLEEVQGQYEYECEYNKQFVACQQENNSLKQQLKSQPAEIVEKIKEQLYSKAIAPTGTSVNCVRLYDIRQILDAILEEYQK